MRNPYRNILITKMSTKNGTLEVVIIVGDA